MACLLQPGTPLVSDAVGASGARPRVFVRNKTGQPVTITAASMNHQAINAGSPPFTLPPLVTGVNVLRLTVENVAAGEVVELVERCDTGEDRVVSEKAAGAAPGGGDPVLGFTIDAQ